MPPESVDLRRVGPGVEPSGGDALQRTPCPGKEDTNDDRQVNDNVHTSQQVTRNGANQTTSTNNGKGESHANDIVQGDPDETDHAIERPSYQQPVDCTRSMWGRGGPGSTNSPHQLNRKGMGDSMSTTNYETSSGMEGSQGVVTTPGSSFDGPPHAEEGPALSLPPCLSGKELRPVAEMDTPTTRFYVGNSRLCLVEAVDMTDSAAIDLDAVLQRVEQKIIKFALQETGGSRAAAARLMGISRSRLYRRLNALGLDNGTTDTDLRAIRAAITRIPAFRN